MKQILLSFLFIAFCTIAFAQEVITVKGVVRDGANQPMPGATVTEKGTTNSVVAANNGAFQIKVKSGAILLFRYLGFVAQEQKVNGRTTINVTLQDDQNNLNEVVVLGYGQIATRKDLNGAVSSVSGTELAKVPVQNVAQALQGRIAGMQVSMSDGTPGSDPQIVARGGTSISQSNDPLYIVDGVPQPDGLGFLDPMDIESVDVLKDGAANIYGSRAANGVVVITTKKLKSGKLTISYDNYVGVKKISNYIPVMDAYEYARLQWERATVNTVRMASFLTEYGSYDSLATRFAGTGINWQEEVFGKPVTSQYHKVSVNGGGAETKFNLFFSRNDDEGIMLNSGSGKNVAKISLSHNVSNKIAVTGTVNYSDQKVTGIGSQGLQGTNAQYNDLTNIFRYRPTMGLRGNDDDFAASLAEDPLLSGNTGYQNPIVGALSQDKEVRTKLLNANVSLRYQIDKHFTYNGVLALRDGSYNTMVFRKAESSWARRTGGPSGSIDQRNTFGWNYNNAISYNNTFNKIHKLGVTLGQEQIYDYTRSFGLSGSGFPSLNMGWDNMSLAAIPGTPTSFAEDNMLISFFARASYSYKGKYSIEGIFRADGSSKFAPKNKWGYFPTALASWKIINEQFMKGNKVFSDLKLRASYGYSGNNRVPNYRSAEMYATGNYPLNNANVATAYLNTMPNPNLRWEVNLKSNIGLDVGLFKQKIVLAAEYFDNRSKDLLYNTPITSTSGFSNQLRNIGKTSSRGFEFTVNSRNIESKAFSWNTSFNIALPKTKVLELNDGVTSVFARTWSINNDYLLQVGQPLGNMYGWVYDGLYTVDDFNYNGTTYTLKNGVPVDAAVSAQPGYLKLKDLNNDGRINDDDRTVIGNAQPRFFGGLNNTFSYKGFDLSIFLNWTQGNKIYNGNKLSNSISSPDYNNMFAYNANRWTTIDQAGNIVRDPAQLAALNEGKSIPSWTGNGTLRLHNGMIEDGSFLRINNINLGYTFPKELIKKAKLSNVRIYLIAYNPYVFTKYSGYDPEVSVVNSTGLTPGVDFGAYPRGRSFMAGLNITL